MEKMQLINKNDCVDTYTYRHYEVRIYFHNHNVGWAVDVFKPTGGILLEECFLNYDDCKSFAKDQITNDLSELEYKNWCADNFSEEEIRFNKEQAKRNPISRESMLQGKLLQVKRMISELIEVGEDYAVFQSAQITHKNLKKAYRLLEGLS